MKHFATFKLNTILFNHINEFYSCLESHPDIFYDEFGWKNASPKEKLAKQHEIVKLILKENENSSHYALNSRHHELAYLRHTSKQILQFLLPDDVLKCRQVDKKSRILIWIFVYLLLNFLLNSYRTTSELVSNLLLKGLDIIAEPDSINKLIKHIVENRNDKNNFNDSAKIQRVQLLKHWSKMNGCIFKSVFFYKKFLSNLKYYKLLIIENRNQIPKNYLK